MLPTVTPVVRKDRLEFRSMLSAVDPAVHKDILKCGSTPVLQSTTPVLLCTTKYYSNTTK